MKRLFGAVVLLFCCSLFIVGCSSTKEPVKAVAPDVNLDNKKVLMVIAQKDFADIELKVPKGILEKTGAKVLIASEEGTEATGMSGAKVMPNSKIKDINVEEYDGILIVGGSGAPTYLWSDPNLHVMLQKAVQSNKYIGAICLAPAVLARAGILKGKEATCFASPQAIAELENGGATYIGNKDLVVSGNIFTGNGPEASLAFGKKAVELLSVK